MKIGIIGAGFVGMGTFEALKGHHEMFIYDKYKEPYKNLKNLKDLAKNCEAVFVCVPTPMKKSGGIDYSNIHDSLNQLAEKCKEVKRAAEDLLVIIRSTAVSGTTLSLSKSYPFLFAFNPEFLREKYYIEDMKNTNRIVIGAEDEKALDKAAQVYKPIFPDANYVLTDTRTAEMIKYASNVMLAGQVAVANEIYNICEALGVSYDKVKEAVLIDPRIGRWIDVPGHDGEFGFGGKCFPKDLNALIYHARENMYRPYLLEEIWRLNERVRKNKDWLNIEGATSENNFEKKDQAL